MSADGIASELGKALDFFLSFDNNDTFHKPEWGEFDFDDIRQDFERTKILVNHLRQLPITALPKDIANQIKVSLVEVTGQLSKIVEFSIRIQNSEAKRNELANNFSAPVEKFYKIAAQWIPFLAYQSGDIQRNIEALGDAQKKAYAILEEAEKYTRKKQSEIDGIVTIARNASASAGAAVFTQDFKKQEDSCNKKATYWLKITLALCTLTIAAAILFYFSPVKDSDKWIVFQGIGARIAVVVALISATVWCGKIYKAFCHQETINNHRALSIQTLQAFAEAVSNTDIRDAVIMEAAKAIYGNVPTGFINDSGGIEGDVKMFGVAKQFADTMKS